MSFTSFFSLFSNEGQILEKASANDDQPTPGYLYNEISTFYMI